MTFQSLLLSCRVLYGHEKAESKLPDTARDAAVSRQ